MKPIQIAVGDQGWLIWVLMDDGTIGRLSNTTLLEEPDKWEFTPVWTTKDVRET